MSNLLFNIKFPPQKNILYCKNDFPRNSYDSTKKKKQLDSQNIAKLPYNKQANAHKIIIYKLCSCNHE